MKQSNQVTLALILAAAAFYASCGSDDPARVGRPPVVDSFQPRSRDVTAFVGDTLRFSIDAFDPDQDDVVTTFELDGTRVAQGREWLFVVSETGYVAVRGFVSDGEHTSFIDWRVQRLERINLAPVIEAAQPIESRPTLVIGSQMSFAVVADDPEHQQLAYLFSVNDSLVSNDRQFIYQASSIGKKRVRALVSDGQHSVAHDWELKVTTEPDTIAPARVTITYAASGAEPGQVDIEWIAVGRDGMTGLPSLYQVRTSPVPFVTEQDWARGSDRPGVPEPAAAGTTMRMVVGGLLPARLTYVGVRAIDDFGNQSPIGPVTSATTRGMRFGGRVIDAMTGQGIAGASVIFGATELITDQDGVYQFVELGPGDGTLIVADETQAGIGAYYNYDTPHTVEHDEVVNLYLLPNYSLQTTMYTDFLQFFRQMTDVDGIPYPAETRRRNLPVGLYARPFSKGGLDYAETIREVAAEFDAIVGFPVFIDGTSLPPERVETTYSGLIERDRYGVTVWSTDWYPLVGLIEFRTVYLPEHEGAFKEIIRHEFGHSLGLRHSLDPQHLMFGGTAPAIPTFSPDEVAVLRSFCRIRRGWDNRRYRRE